jgi:hypothetical protein
MPVTMLTFMFIQRTLLKKREKYYDTDNRKNKKKESESTV